MDKITFIPEDALEDRRVYALRSRNLRFGAWNVEDQSFYGVRQKFNSRYIDNEYQWGETLGTANATEALDIWVPEDIPLKGLLYVVCRYCGGRTESVYEFDQEMADKGLRKGQKCIGDRHLVAAEAAACEVGDVGYLSWWLSNKPLLDFMEVIESDRPWDSTL